MNTNTNELWSIGTVARLLGLSIETLRRWDERGYIQPIKTEGGHRRFRLEDVQRFADNREESFEIDRLRRRVESLKAEIAELKEA